MGGRERILLTAMATACAVLAQEAPALFTPANQSLVVEPKLRIAGRAGAKAQLMLDGMTVPFAQPAAGVVMGEVALTPGMHELTLKDEVGEAKVWFFAGKEHEGWPTFRPHPPLAVGCDTCHAVKNEVWSLKRASPSLLCHSCHDKEKFPSVHTHNTDTLADCQNCHMPHGSAKAHMKTPKAVACKQRHS